jgi:molecular chaperone GrpE
VIDAAGQKFDPTEQDAVSLAVPEDPALDDTVAATFQKGYRFRGTVIRPAKVQVYSVDGAI